MSLQSLTALKTLVQTREQAATIQNDNLDQVQRQVQDVGSSEARRVDDLHLEKAKAEYEVALTQAKIQRIESQLAREQKAVENAHTIMIVTGALSAGSNLWNLGEDFLGKNKLSDQKSDSNGNTLANGNNNFTSRFNIGGQESRNKDGKVTSSEGGSIQLDVADRNARGVQAVGITNFNGDGSVGKNRVAFISQKDLDDAVTKFNNGKPDDQKIDASKIKSFEDLARQNPGIAIDLANSKSRDIQRNEAGQFVKAASGERATSISAASRNSSFDDTNKIRDNLASKDTRVSEKGGIFNDFTKSSSIKDRIEDNLDATGVRKSGLKSVGEGTKSVLNAVVSFASDVSPFYQAYIKMKDQRDNTLDQLIAEKKKLAAEVKKLKAIEQAIANPAQGAEGTGGNKELEQTKN